MLLCVNCLFFRAYCEPVFVGCIQRFTYLQLESEAPFRCVRGRNNIYDPHNWRVLCSTHAPSHWNVKSEQERGSLGTASQRIEGLPSSAVVIPHTVDEFSMYVMASTRMSSPCVDAVSWSKRAVSPRSHPDSGETQGSLPSS